VLTNMTPSGTIHTVYDRDGNLLMESNGLATGLTREYVWLPETQIAPTMGSQAGVPRPIAVVDAVNTATPATWWVSTDHLNRPVRMTDAAKATVWQATWKPFGEPQSITGSATLDARFPGQWFQLESGLHQNWWRHYDPTTGRYTQVDPLGVDVDASVYDYVANSPLLFVDPRGLYIYTLPDGTTVDIPGPGPQPPGKPGTYHPPNIPPAEKPFPLPGEDRGKACRRTFNICMTSANLCWGKLRPVCKAGCVASLIACIAGAFPMPTGFGPGGMSIPNMSPQCSTEN
jgi:RHS repeat-associated protein